MKKLVLLIVFICSIFLLSTNSFALSYYLDMSNTDVGADTNGDSDSTTGLWDSWDLQGALLASQFDNNSDGSISIGDTVTQDIIFYSTGFTGLGSTAANEGLQNDLASQGGYQITGIINNAQAEVTAINDVTNFPDLKDLQLNFTSADLDIYIGELVDDKDPYDEVTLADGSNPSSINTVDYDGTTGSQQLLASGIFKSGFSSPIVNVTGGDTPSDQDTGSASFTFELDKSTMLDDVWFTDKDLDIKDGIPSDYATFAFPDVGLDDTVTTTVSNIDGDLLDAKQAIGNQATFVTTPEPTTLLLFGTGLLGLGFFGRRKFITKKS